MPMGRHKSAFKASPDIDQSNIHRPIENYIPHIAAQWAKIDAITTKGCNKSNGIRQPKHICCFTKKALQLDETMQKNSNAISINTMPS